MKKNNLIFLLILIGSLLLSGCDTSKKEIKSLEDAKHVRIGAMTGSTGEMHARERFPEAPLKSFDDIMDGVAALKSDQIDAVITAYSNAINICKKNPELHSLEEVVEYENTAIALRKGEDLLLAELNRFILKLKNDGTLKDMRKRWFKLDFSPYKTVSFNLPKTGKVLKIGVAATREPFCFIDENREVTGHDGELARRISVELNRPIEFVDMKFSALIPALKSGKIDLIITGMSSTPERKKSVDFTESYFDNAQVLIVKKENQTGTPANTISSAEDLKTKKIGVLLGSVHDTYANKNFPNATLLQYKSPSDLLLGVKTGKIDAAFYTYETLLDILRKDIELGFVAEKVFTVPIGIGFNKENDALREQFNTFFAKLKSSGIYDDMKNRWITQGSEIMPEIPNGGKNGELIIGTVSDKGLPFTIIKNNRLIGFDIELAERFAAFLDKKLKFVDMEFGNLIAAASTNKIDAVFSTLMITPERQKQIDFSDPYMELGASIFALKKNLAAFNSSSANNTDPGFLEKVKESFYSNIILENRYLLILEGLQTTILISILATLFGTLLGGVVCFMRMSKNILIKTIAKIYISILRGTPVLVVLMIIFYVIFASVDIDPVLVAVLAFGLNFAAYVSEMFRTGIEGVDNGQTEAGIALGFSKLKTFIFIVMPQAVRRILPVYKGEFITLVKMTSIVGYIAVQDLTKASDIIRSRTFDAFFPLIFVAVLYFLISWLLLLSLGYVEKITDPRLKNRRRK